MIQVTINGEDVTKYVKVNSFRILDAVNNRSTCEFTFLDTDNNRSYVKGIPVQVTGDDGMLFSGFIDSATYTKLGMGRNIGIKCADMHYLGDKRVIAKSYKAISAGAMVRDILTQKLKDEGVRGFDIVKEFDHSIDWQTGTMVNLISSDAYITLTDAGVDVAHLFTLTNDFTSGTLSNISASGDQMCLTKEGTDYSNTWTTTANFDTGTKTNVTSAGDQLQATTYVGYGAWPNGYNWRKSHHINGSADGNLSNFQMLFLVYAGSGTDYTSGDIGVIYLNGKSLSWGSVGVQDIRFTNSAGTNLPYWLITGYGNTTYAYLYVKVDSIPTSGTDIYIYFGKSGDGGASDGASTFVFFDDFDSYDTTTKWNTVNGSPSASGSVLTCASSARASTKATYGVGYAAMVCAWASSTNCEAMAGFQTINWEANWNFSYNTGTTIPRNCNNGGYTWGSAAGNDKTNWHVYESRRVSGTNTYFYYDFGYNQNVGGGSSTAIPLSVWQWTNGTGTMYAHWALIKMCTPNTPVHGASSADAQSPVNLYYTSSSWQSASTSIATPVYSRTSSVSWNCNIPSGCSLLIKTSINGGSSWQTIATSGNAIGNLTLRTVLTGMNVLVRAEMTNTGTATVTIYDITVAVTTAYKTSGTWTSSAVALDNVISYASGTVTWSAPNIPAGCNVTVYASTNGTDFSTISSSGGAIPNYTLLTNMSGKSVWVRVVLGSDGSATPTFYDITTTAYTAYNTTASWTVSTDIGDAGESDGANLTWTVSTPAGSSVTVQTSVDNTNWSTIANSGDPIPDVAGAGELIGMTLYVRVSFTSNGTALPNMSYLKINVYNSTIQDGLMLEEAVFNYCTCSRAIDRLAQRCGYWWCISATRVLYFMPVTQIPSGWGTLTLDDVRNSSVSVINGNTKYVNTQYVKGAYDITAQQTQTLTCDGKTTSWALAYPLNQEPVVKIGGTTQTIGVKGTGATQKFYWQKSDPVIYYNGAATDLPAGTALTVAFYGEFPIVVMSSDSGEIYGRQSIEGVGSGVVEGVTEDQSLNTRDASYQLAANLLGTNGKIGNTVTVDTYYRGLYAGEYITVQLPKYDIDESDMLIQQVETTISSGRVKYKATITENHPDDWTNMFQTLADKSLSIRENISENEVLVQTFSQGDTWTWTDSFTNTSVPTVYPSDTTYPSDTIYPSG